MKAGETRQQLLGEYIAATGCTVRECARAYGIGKSTVHTDVTQRLRQTDKALYNAVRNVLEKNKKERHLRGGLATKEKYRKRQQP